MMRIGVYEDGSEAMGLSLGEEWPQPTCPGENGNKTEKDLSFLRPRRAHKGDIVLTAGFSLAIHAAVVVMAALMHLFVVPSPEHRGSFITVNLVGPADAGTGSEGAGNGSASESGSPYPAAAVQSHTPDAARTVRDETASRRPMAELCSMKAQVEMNQEKNQPPALGNAARSEATPVAAPVPRKSSVQKDRKKILAVREPKTEPPAAASSASAALSSPVHSAGVPSVCRDFDTSGDGGGGAGSGGKAGHDAGGPSSGGSHGGMGHGSNRFELKQVDQAPSPIRKVEPEFPPAARRMGVGGSVVVRFLVKADGSVGEASVVRAEPGGVFERNALEAVGKWRFKPGLHRGEAVATWVVLSVQFRLSK
jgi:periplasmic protein TonB